MRRSSFVLALLFTAALGGCSSETADLFKTGATGSGGAGGAGVTTSTKSATSTSTNPPDTTGVTSAVSTTGSTNPDTVASSSSGPVQTVSVQASSSSGPLGNFVDCANAGQCEVDDTHVCCWDDNDSEGACTLKEDCALNVTGQFLTAVSCQSPLDCPGQICCGHRYFGDGGQVYEDTSCTNTCQQPDVQLCDQNVPNICPFYVENGQQKQMVCKPSQILPPGYFVCGKP